MKRDEMIPLSEYLRSVNAGVLLHVRLRVWKVDSLSYSGFEASSEVLRHDGICEERSRMSFQRR